MRSQGFFVGSVALLVLALPVRAEEKPKNAELAARIRQAVLAKMPREYEDRSEWGRTIPPPPAVRFPRLRRTAVKVGDHYEFPHGAWKRTKVWVADPVRDLRIEVPSVRQAGKGTSRLTVEATVALRGSRERQQWVNGVRLLGVTADADALVRVGVDVDVTVGFDPTHPLDGVKVEAKVDRIRLDLLDFQVRRVGPVVVLEQGPLGEELKTAIQERMRALEPKVKEYANQAIAKGVADGKGLPLLPSGK